ncbi:metal ABC transporter solute-binding protein, Zn/Mn family [Corynebacterium sp. 335C]
MTTTIHRPTLRRSAALLAAAGLAAALGACSDDQNAGGDAGTTAAGSGGDETAKVTVVTSTNTWSDVANEVVGDADVSVTPIIDSNEADPHSYQPSAQDMALIEQADIVVAGGGHYDVWMTSAAKDTDAVIVSALAPDEHGHDHAHGHDHDHAHGEEGHDHSHDHGEEGHDHAHGEEGHDHAHGHSHGDSTDITANEHVFYSTDAITKVAEELSKAVNEKAGEEITDPDAVYAKVEEITEAKRELGHYHVAQTHPLGDYIIQNSEVHDITPEGFRKATLNEQEPAAADVNEMLELIKSGDLDFLIDSPQTTDAVSERLVEAAEAEGLPIVKVWETPAKGESFFDLYLKTIEEMQKTGDAATK